VHINRVIDTDKKYFLRINVLLDKLLDAMAIVESGGNPKAYNKSTGASGTLQLTQIVYKNICNMDQEAAFDPDKNRACAKIYLLHLLNKYKGNISAAVRHYNQGYMKVETNYVSKVHNELASNP
jgi:soluble lytic murein transglycosylase-like protein